MEKIYARTVGWISFLLVLFHYLKSSLVSMLPFDTPHLLINLLIGLLGIRFAQKTVQPRSRRMFIVILAACFLISGVFGFFMPQLMGYGFTFIQNLLHLMFGTWGIWCILPHRVNDQPDTDTEDA